MEYRMRCNTCGQIWCYTDSDIKSQELEIKRMKAAMTASIFDALAGDMVSSREALLLSRGKLNDFSRCPNCNSTQITQITDDALIEIKETPLVVTDSKRIEINPQASPESLLRRAELFIEDGDWDAADTYLNALLDIEPENGEAYYYKQLVMWRVKNIDEAKIACGTHITSIPLISKLQKFHCDKSEELIRVITERYREIEQETREQDEINKMESDRLRVDSLKQQIFLLNTHNYKATGIICFLIAVISAFCFFEIYLSTNSINIVAILVTLISLFIGYSRIDKDKERKNMVNNMANEICRLNSEINEIQAKREDKESKNTEMSEE